MKKNMKYSKDDSGQVVMFVIFVVLFLVLFVSLFISNSLARQSKIAVAAANSVQAYYIADSGAENVLYNLSLMPADDTLDENEAIPLESQFNANGWMASANVSELAASGGRDRIDIIGTYKTTSRAIQLFW